MWPFFLAPIPVKSYDVTKSGVTFIIDRLNHKWNVKAGGVVPNNGLSNQSEIFVRKKR